MGGLKIHRLLDKQVQVVLFSSTAIALYGYDQGTPCPVFKQHLPSPLQFQ